MKALAAKLTDQEFYNDGATEWRPESSKAAMAKGAQSVIFFNKPKLDRAASEAEGRPIYVKVPYVRITQPGDRDNVVMRPVWIDDTGQVEMADTNRFKELWETFKTSDAEESIEGGTPLSAVPFLSRENVEELKHFHVTTVEGLANMPDANLSRFMGLRALSRLAKDFLDAAKDGAVITRLHGEINEKASRLNDLEKKMTDQAETIRQLREMMEAQQRGMDAASGLRQPGPLKLAEDEPEHKDLDPGQKVLERSGFLRPKKKE